MIEKVKKTRKNKVKEETVKNDIKTDEIKTYIYNVRVVNKNGEVLRRYKEKTAKEIDSIKKTLSNNESVKYMPVGFKKD